MQNVQQEKPKAKKEFATIQDSPPIDQMSLQQNIQGKPKNADLKVSNLSTKAYFQHLSRIFCIYKQYFQDKLEKELFKENSQNKLLNKMGLSFIQNNHKLIISLSQQCGPEDFCQRAGFFQQNYHQQLESFMLKSKRFKKLDTFTTKPIIHEIYPSRHYQIVKLEVQLLWYKTQISILHEAGKSPLHQHIEAFGTGSFGSVFLVRVLDEQVAIKSISLPQQTASENQQTTFLTKVLINAIKEYFFVLLFSQLQIGPKVKNIGGFDLVMYEGFIDFATEICQIPEFKSHYSDEISKNLFKMHMFQIVHRDIKPANIVYSKTFQKQVFIDFGCTEVLNVKIGYKTLTTLIGTPAYCSQEVMKLLKTKKGWVDLYYNDLFALFKSIKNKKKDSVFLNPKQVNPMKGTLLEQIPLKFSLYNKNFEVFYNLWKLLKFRNPQNNLRRQLHIMKFIQQITISSQIKLFYQKEIDEIIKDAEEFHKIKLLIRKQKLTLVSELIPNSLKQKENRFFRQLYQVIKIQYGCGNIEQKQLDLVMATKNNVENFIESVVDEFKIKKHLAKKNDEVKQRDDWQHDIHHQTMVKLCFAVANYSSMSQNKYNATLEEKINACKITLQILQDSNYPEYKQFTPLFSNKADDQLDSISRFYQFYITKMSFFLSMHLKSQQMVNSITTLCLIGCPYDIQNFVYFFVSHFFLENAESIKSEAWQPISEYQYSQGSYSQSVQKVTIVLWINFMIHVFKNILYNQQNFEVQAKLYPSQQFIKRIRLEFDRAMTVSMTQQTQKQGEQQYNLIHLNSRIHHQKNLHRDKLTQEMFRSFLDQLLSEKIVAISQLSAKNQKLWQLLCLDLIFIEINAYRQRGKQLSLQLKERLIPSLQYQTQVLPFQTFYQLFYPSVLNIPSEFFDKIDSIVSCRKISLRFKIQHRLLIALRRRDFETVDQIIHIIKNDFDNREINISALKSFYIFFQTIETFIFNQCLEQTPQINIDLLKILLVCRPIISLALKIGEWYIKYSSEPRCIYSIQIDQKKHSDILFTLHKTKTIGLFFSYIRRLIIFYNKAQSLIVSKNFIDQNRLKYQNKIQFHPHDLQLIKSLQQSSIVFSFNTKWCQLILQNNEILKTFKEDKRLKNGMLQIINTFYYTKLQVPMLEQVYERICDIKKKIVCSIPQLCQKLTSFYFAFQYLRLKLFNTQFQSSQCLQLIDLSKHAKKHDVLFVVFLKPQLIHSLLNSFVYLQKPYHQLMEIFIDLTDILQVQPNHSRINELKQKFNKLFWCKCLNCFPRKWQKWEPNKFGDFLNSNIYYLNPKLHPYMSLICFEFMQTQDMQTKKIPIYRNLIVYILKSIPFLIPSAQQLMLPKMNFMIYLASNKEQPELDRKFLYLYRKYKKYEYNNARTLQDALKSMFIKQKIVKNYKYPQQIKSLYQKKLVNFFKIKQNYKRQSAILEFYIQTHR